MQLLTILIGALGGVSVGLQTPIANAIGKRVGSSASSFIIHLSGLIFSTMLLVSRGGEDIRNWRAIPWWMFIVGIFGLILYLTLNHTIPRLGTATAITLLIVGQLGTGLVIDQFGLLGVTPRPIDGYRLLAVGFLLIGGYLMAR